MSKRYIPYGYTVRKGLTVIENNEAGIIREIFDQYIKGASLQMIADSLTSRRIPYVEKTDRWDKARISRIIGNSRYTGSREYDPIIDEDIYRRAVDCRTARRCNNVQLECEAVNFIRSRVRCAECGSMMVRNVNSKYKIKESWNCTNPECRKCVRISDGLLLDKVNLLMNRIISDTSLLIPKPHERTDDNPVVEKLQNELDTALSRDNPDEEYIIEKIRQIAYERYRSANTDEMIVAELAMKPQDSFNGEYFSAIIDNIILGEHGSVRILKLITKTNVEIKGEQEIWQ